MGAAMSKHQPTIKNFRVADIRVLGKHRPLVKEKVRMLADSIKAIGLKTPPTVRLSKKGPVLVTGRHRLAAVKKLGRNHIPCIVMRGDKIDRQLWRIAENLHRGDLTKLQRAENIKKWDELIKKRGKGGQAAQPGGRQPHDKGLSKTAKQLGISREAVRRSKKIAGISPKAKKAAKKEKLDDNQAALLKAAKKSTPKGQTKTLRELAKNKQASRGHSPSPREVKQLKALKKAYAGARKFKKAWKRASAAVRQKFVKSVLQPSI
jgi:ParB family transcriptional regulator, chromosome partitioning protein